VLNRPWEFHKLFITASRFSYAVGSVKCSHVLREGNCTADALAKEGPNRIGGLVLTSHTFKVD
jgi:ribosomal protein L34E